MAVSHRGAISFEMVHIPVGLYTATQDNDIHFNQLCKEDGSRVTYKKVCANCGKENHMTSIVLGQYRNGHLVYKGHVTLGVCGEGFRHIRELPTLPVPSFAVPAGNVGAVWLEPRLVCTVQYMMKTEGGGMRQSVFKGLREDKIPVECTESML